MSGGGATNVKSGGTLGGYGSVTGSVTNKGVLAAGNATPGFGDSPTGTFTINGELFNEGTLQLASEDSVGNVLQVSGNYVGAGGTMFVNTVLGSDNSSSDRLVIDGGTASGDTRVVVTDIGGGGALTTGDGILVVDAENGGTTQSRSFTGFAVAGPYEYLLVRGGSTDENDWFLRNTITEGGGDDGGDGGGGGASGGDGSGAAGSGGGSGTGAGGSGGGGTVLPRYRREVSLYAAMPVAAVIYGRTLIETLHERMGGDAELLKPAHAGTPDGGWGRLIGLWGHRDGDPIGIYGSEGPSFDYDFGALQAGLDLYRSDLSNGARDNAGLYLAVGHGKVDVEHNLLGRTFSAGTDKFNAYSVGGYWTRFGERNWYLDGVVQGTWYDIDMSGQRGLRDGETDAFGFGASLEGGYPFELGAAWKLEPQAQLVYQGLNISDFNDGAANVRYSDTDSLAGRVGAISLAAGSWQVPGQSEWTAPSVAGS